MGVPASELLHARLLPEPAFSGHNIAPKLTITLFAALSYLEGKIKSRAQVFSLYRTAAKAGFLRREARRNTSPKYA
jgi:hypothetical protein